MKFIVERGKEEEGRNERNVGGGKTFGRDREGNTSKMWNMKSFGRGG